MRPATGPAVSPLAGTGAMPVRGAAGARPAREATRVPVPGAPIPTRTVTRRRRVLRRDVPRTSAAGRAPPGHRSCLGPSRPGRPGGRELRDAPTALTDSAFASAGPEPGFADPDAQDTGEQHSHGGRRRITKVQKPQLRLGRSRQDYDNDPWPSADEVDGVPDDQYWSDLSSDKPLATTARAAQNAGDDEPWAPGAGLAGFAIPGRRAGCLFRARRGGRPRPRPRPPGPGPR